MSSARIPRWAGPLLGTAIALAAMAGLHALGAGTLAAPPTTSGQDLLDWVRSTDPTTVGMVALRLLALAVGYHLIATTALGVIGRVMRRPGLVRLAEWATLPPFRSTVRRVAGLGLSASAVLLTPLQGVGASGSGPATAQVSASAPVVSAGQATATWRRPTTGPSTATLRLINTAPDEGPGGQATLRPVDPGQENADSADDLRPDTAPTDATPAEPTPTADPEQHPVAPGDHLWAIAEERLATSIGRAPTDAEIAPYWRTVVAANADLADPDLLLPGSIVAVPAPPG